MLCCAIVVVVVCRLAVDHPPVHGNDACQLEIKILPKYPTFLLFNSFSAVISRFILLNILHESWEIDEFRTFLLNQIVSHICLSGDFSSTSFIVPPHFSIFSPKIEFFPPFSTNFVISFTHITPTDQRRNSLLWLSYTHAFVMTLFFFLDVTRKKKKGNFHTTSSTFFPRLFVIANAKPNAGTHNRLWRWPPLKDIQQEQRQHLRLQHLAAIHIWFYYGH